MQGAVLGESSIYRDVLRKRVQAKERTRDDQASRPRMLRTFGLLSSLVGALGEGVQKREGVLEGGTGGRIPSKFARSVPERGKKGGVSEEGKFCQIHSLEPRESFMVWALTSKNSVRKMRTRGFRWGS